MLIAGYYGIQQDKAVTRKCIGMFLKIAFYSLLVSLIYYCFLGEPIQGKNPIRIFLPMFYGDSWFCMLYIILHLLSPYLGKMVRAISQKEYLTLIAILIAAWSLLPVMKFTTYMGSGADIVHFCIIYLIGAYIRIYGCPNFLKSKAFLICTFLLHFIVVVGFDSLGYVSGNDGFIQNATMFCGYTSPIVLMMSITLFAIFTKYVFHSAIINYIAAGTMATYLLHDSIRLRKYVWLVWSPNFLMLESKYLIVHMILKSILILIISVVFDGTLRWIVRRVFKDVSVGNARLSRRERK